MLFLFFLIISWSCSSSCFAIRLTSEQLILCKESYGKWPPLCLPNARTPSTPQFKLISKQNVSDLLTVVGVIIVFLLSLCVLPFSSVRCFILLTHPVFFLFAAFLLSSNPPRLLSAPSLAPALYSSIPPLLIQLYLISYLSNFSRLCF